MRANLSFRVWIFRIHLRPSFRIMLDVRRKLR